MNKKQKKKKDSSERSKQHADSRQTKRVAPLPPILLLIDTPWHRVLVRYLRYPPYSDKTKRICGFERLVQVRRPEISYPANVDAVFSSQTVKFRSSESISQWQNWQRPVFFLLLPILPFFLGIFWKSWASLDPTMFGEIRKTKHRCSSKFGKGI